MPGAKAELQFGSKHRRGNGLPCLKWSNSKRRKGKTPPLVDLVSKPAGFRIRGADVGAAGHR